MSVIKKRFELLKNTALYLRGTTAKERIEKLNRIWDGIVERKDDLYTCRDD